MPQPLQPTRAVRNLLRHLRRPYLLAQNPLANQLRKWFKARSFREAISRLIDRAFILPDESSERLREILIRSGIKGQKSTAVAGIMHLSLRQYFRCRAQAIEILAAAVGQFERAILMRRLDRWRIA